MRNALLIILGLSPAIVVSGLCWHSHAFPPQRTGQIDWINAEGIGWQEPGQYVYVTLAPDIEVRRRIFPGVSIKADRSDLSVNQQVSIWTTGWGVSWNTFPGQSFVTAQVIVIEYDP